MCINQEDKKEKECHVPLMGTVYSQCDNAIIWLGEHNWLTKPAFEGIKFISSRPMSSVVPHLHEYDWKRIRRSSERGGPARRHLLWRAWDTVQGLHSAAAFSSIFNRPWFSRLWVMQELALSPQAVVVCGKMQIDWDLVDRAASVWATNFDVQNHVAGLRDLRNWPDDSPRDILGHMLVSWHNDVERPRDKVYGLMGIQSRMSRVLPIKMD
ncbi:hypothetical protein F5Y15DRAFT_396337 [Xylariaceae sp. FL0016]|nr:hypothetical protein F5Y15DRAFT_396337 [Xylariaceae sp. FL0016]